MMVLKRKTTPEKEERKKKEANWFYQFWPDIRKQLVVTMFLSISTGIVTVVTMFFTQQQMQKDMSEMQLTINKVDSLVTVLNAQKNKEVINTVSEKDSIINLLLKQNQEFLNHITKK